LLLPLLYREMPLIHVFNFKFQWDIASTRVSIVYNSYTTIRHNICLKSALYLCKRTVLKVLCYQNIYAEKHGRNLHVHIFIGDNHGE